MQEELPSLPVILTLLLGLFVLVFVISRNFIGIARLLLHSFTPLSKAGLALLEQHSACFQGLSAGDKKEFARRVKEVLYEKEWIGRNMVLELEKKVRIAATLVQLTFGLERLLLLHFKRIVVHPEEYRDRTTGKMHQGGVRPATGTITLSWKHFEKGYDDPHDARNVGLHELAHALWMENKINNQESDFLDRNLVREWQHEAAKEIALIRQGRGRLFRDYAGTDQAEFFAVAVEYFFEQPMEFSQRMAECYAIIARLLGQDPAGTAAHPQEA